MADTPVLLNNYSDDSQIKAFMQSELAVRVFHDIPLNVLNAGQFSLTTEYISQITEQLSFTSAFYYNENFITKAILPDSIYAEAAIFNIGYSFATPASSNFLLELRIDDIMKNAVFNPDNDLYEFILDKDTKFNLPEGFVYSLDYDILIQYKNEATATMEATNPAWNIQYINRDQVNMCATNKNLYLPYRVTNTWLCIFVQANEYERETHRVVNNTGAAVPNADTVITCTNHIAGFDIKYIDSNGNETYLSRDHILTIHNKVKDLDPYVNYIMDDPYTIRFMWQLAGNGYFVPDSNSSYEIIIYTCHGKAANAPNYKNDKQPQIITATNRYTNNANVMKAVFVIGSCMGGTDIGTTETVRRQTIEAYNTANVISSDHDIDEWFKTFYFKGLLYPYFFKRRDDPWGRIWSGYVSLTNDADNVYKTNTLHAALTYSQLYDNSDTTVSSNEIIIPPGWLWTYSNGGNLYTVKPYIENGTKIEDAKSLANISDKFVFANPFGIRIQKDPFAIGYFNPWVNQYNSASHVDADGNKTSLYHASHIISHIERTYINDYYDITSTLTTNVSALITGEPLITYTKSTAMTPALSDSLWDYFKKPLDPYSSSIPFMRLTNKDQVIPFDPDMTYLCCTSYDESSDGSYYKLNGLYILDYTSNPESPRRIDVGVDASIFTHVGDIATWKKAVGIPYTDNPDIYLQVSPSDLEDYLSFTRIPSKNYYELRLPDNAPNGAIKRMVVTLASETELSKYGEVNLVKLGGSYQTVVVNIYYDAEGMEKHATYKIINAANVYTPYAWDPDRSDVNANNFVFDLSNVGANGIILYTDMKPSPSSGAVAYFRLKFSDVSDTLPLFYLRSSQLELSKNNMRVVMSAIAEGAVTGTVEMLPVNIEQDGSYIFNTTINPLTELIDLDNRIFVASTTEGGGSWINATGNKTHLDVTNPQLKLSILIRNMDDPNKESSPAEFGNAYAGYMVVDEYMLDDVDLVQELKEMRSVVDFGDNTPPTGEQQNLYDTMIKLDTYVDGVYNIYDMKRYAHDRYHDLVPDSYTDSAFIAFKTAAASNREILNVCFTEYAEIVSEDKPNWFDGFYDMLDHIATFEQYILLTEKPEDWDPTQYYRKVGNDFIPGTEDDVWAYDLWYEKTALDWEAIYNQLNNYKTDVDDAFSILNVNGDVVIQQVPFVARSLITSEDFAQFVAVFTQVHKAIEPVIFSRLEGNNYLDCKLIATYGKPHSYSADIDVEDPNKFWPDLSVQIEFDVKLYDNGLDKTTVNDLKDIIKSYFNRITTVHTPTQNLSMDNNIYISNLIQKMEEHKNVAWLKFKGWYTDEKNVSGGNYMSAIVQAIVQKWKKLEDMPTDELERYVPEMFLLEPSNIVINVIK